MGHLTYMLLNVHFSKQYETSNSQCTCHKNSSSSVSCSIHLIIYATPQAEAFSSTNTCTVVGRTNQNTPPDHYCDENF